MDLNIRAGQRVAYKCGNSGWITGNIKEGNAEITPLGLFIPIIPKDGNAEEEYHWAEINDMYLDAKPVEDWMEQYGYLLTKDQYIKFINSDDFNKNFEHAYVSDGEYYYYSINKFTEQWINKQPFEYVVREE